MRSLFFWSQFQKSQNILKSQNSCNSKNKPNGCYKKTKTKKILRLVNKDRENKEETRKRRKIKKETNDLMPESACVFNYSFGK